MIKDIVTIARFTLIQINKSKVLINVVFLTAIIALLSYVLAEFTHGVPSKISLDIGFGLATLSSVGIAIFLGVQIISLEIESRTIYMIISRPVNRFSFYLGKMLGMSLFLTFNSLIVCFVSIFVYLNLGGQWSELLFIAILSICLEAILTLFIVVALAFIVNNVISVMTTIILYVTGHGIEDAKSLSYVLSRPWLEDALKVYAKIMPNYSNFNLKRYTFYSLDLYPEQWRWSLVYACLYIVFVAVVSMLILKKKNFD